MSSPPSREYSPDWLRDAKASTATTSIFTLLSSSSSDEDDEDDKLPIGSVIGTTTLGSKPRNGKNESPEKSLPADLPREPKTSVSETFLYDSDHDRHPMEVDVEASSFKLEDTESKAKGPTKQENDDDMKVLETEKTDKQTGSYISSSRLPLVLADKVQRTKVLVECEGESIDLSGDLGTVGRVVMSDSLSGNQDMLLDLKGTIYKTTIIPSTTFCVVNFGQSEAKIEAIMNDFLQLKPQSNVYEAETMVEGTLEGFSFDSEDEGDKQNNVQVDENDGAEPHTNGKGKGKGKSEKASEATKKKGKVAVKKPVKKVKRKAPVAKKTKTKK
uniref:DNA-binding protein BIN4 isoform X2 n=1 Tax=Erigeron canadensis TaxID=72917 RepID=UPI001CB96B7F|nr:DNA-binding protein BIN4 isoform X2 [Erigeron canadensis]